MMTGVGMLLFVGVLVFFYGLAREKFWTFVVGAIIALVAIAMMLRMLIGSVETVVHGHVDRRNALLDESDPAKRK